MVHVCHHGTYPGGDERPGVMKPHPDGSDPAFTVAIRLTVRAHPRSSAALWAKLLPGGYGAGEGDASGDEDGSGVGDGGRGGSVTIRSRSCTSAFDTRKIVWSPSLRA